ncbi:MAG: hypothetical protein HY514_01550 [Candidatus Aenigmarchaeota archaeon]|nr:hypothetical protein [Candidatus Aenigmarchaeota archaeon]
MVMEYLKRPLSQILIFGALATAPAYSQDSLRNRIEEYLRGQRSSASENYTQRSFFPNYSWLNTHVGGRTTTRNPFTSERPRPLSVRPHPYGDKLIVRKQSPSNGSRVTRIDLDRETMKRRAAERLQLWLNRH